MADVVQKATKKASKPKKPTTHPKYSEMVRAAITSLKERGGSSRQAVLRYILSHYDVGKDEKAVNTHLKLALKSGVKKGALKQAKGTGASGSFRLGSSAEKPKRATKAKTPKAAKPKKLKKAKSPAKKKAKKPAAKKAKSPAKKKPAAKKAAAPAKKAPAKKPKSPKKKAAAKPKAAKSKAKGRAKKTVKK